MTSCARSKASSICASETSRAPASTIRIAFFGPGDHEVERRLGDLGLGGVDHVRAVDQAHPDRPDGAGEGDVGDGERRRGAEHGVHVGQVVHLGRQRHGDHLDFVAHPLGEQRAQRPVDQAGRQDRLFAGAAAALDEAAGDLADGVLALFVVAGEGEEVQPGAYLGVHGGRGQDDGVAAADQDRPVGLLGEAAGLEGNDPPVGQRHLNGMWHILFFSSFCARKPPPVLQAAVRPRCSKGAPLSSRRAPGGRFLVKFWSVYPAAPPGCGTARCLPD